MDVDQLLAEVLLKRPRRLVAILVLLTVALAACSKTAVPGQVSCPSSDPLRGIYSPGRLKVLGECRWFRGTVTESDTRSDGDLHLLLTADSADADMLNVENVNAGGMIVEIVPGQQLPEPAVGDHIAVFGTYVFDEHNGWNEIHPVWAYRDLGTGETFQALPPASPSYDGGGND